MPPEQLAEGGDQSPPPRGVPTWGWWRKETIIVALVSISLTYWGVKVSEGARIDALGARLDGLGTRLDAANKQNDDLTQKLMSMKQHERSMWTLANEICRHLVEEEEQKAQGAQAAPTPRPPGYIPGSVPPVPSAQRFQKSQLCSLMPADPGPP